MEGKSHPVAITRKDIHLTKIQFLQTLRNMPLFFTPDMVIFLQGILLLRLDLDTT